MSNSKVILGKAHLSWMHGSCPVPASAAGHRSASCWAVNHSAGLFSQRRI